LRLAHAARIASERGLAGAFSDFSLVIPPLKTLEIWPHKISMMRR
jgi:hypothetical protein